MCSKPFSVSSSIHSFHKCVRDIYASQRVSTVLCVAVVLSLLLARREISQIAERTSAISISYVLVEDGIHIDISPTLP